MDILFTSLIVIFVYNYFHHIIHNYIFFDLEEARKDLSASQEALINSQRKLINKQDESIKGKKEIILKQEDIIRTLDEMIDNRKTILGLEGVLRANGVQHNH